MLERLLDVSQFPNFVLYPLMKMSSTPRAAIKEGKNSAWGQLPDIPHKTNKFGLGFTAAGQKTMRRSRIERAPVKISPYGINALEDEDKESNIEEWIYPTVRGGLSNWEAKDFVPITFTHQ